MAVIGAGAWGTVLALLLARGGNRVRLWARRAEHADAMLRERQNRERLPDIELPPAILPTSDLEQATDGVAAALVAVPSGAVEAMAERLQAVPALVSCSKGLLGTSLTRPSEVLRVDGDNRGVAVLSGPNLASEIAAGMPTGAVAASTDAELAGRVQAWLQGPSFRVYTSPDPVGVEIAGAVKNVIALAAGMSDGLGLGENARATIVTRGLAEMVRLGLALGAERETFYGLAGLGDVVATCSSNASRNHRAGERIAHGCTPAELAVEGLTVEGIPTVRAVHLFADRRGLELPISAEVYRVLFEGKSPSEAMRDLMTRGRKAEW